MSGVFAEPPREHSGARASTGTLPAPPRERPVPGGLPRVTSPALAALVADPSREHRDALMRRVAQDGTPLVDPVPVLGATGVAGGAGDGVAGRDEDRVYTFLHVGGPATRRVLLDVEGLVGPGTHRQAVLEQVPGTSLWAVALRMPAAWRATYAIAVDDGGLALASQDSADAARLVGLEERRALARAASDPTTHADLDAWFDLLRRAEPDPLARETALLGEESVVVGPRAPRLPGPLAALAAGPVDGEVSLAPRGWFRAAPVPDGAGWKAWWHVPPVDPGPDGWDVVVLLDGGRWRSRGQGLLDAMTAAGVLRPTVTLLVQHDDAARRTADLACSPAFVAALVSLLEGAGDVVRGPVARDPQRTTIAGRGLGGLAALYAQCVAPRWFGASVCQSGEWGWPSPSGRGSGDDLEWLTGAVSRAAAEPDWGLGRVHLEVGTQERALLPPTRRLRDALAGRCESLAYREVEGGHDAAWWDVTLPQALAATAP
ncbi:hypothetical protein DNL40_05945 [Xylanimonas oleitrophica]|uniref:Enterochelin esterase N-terminal domain-containing protein n=1 Tax=Xylanimonas oleitrophica TaxID=2607479 RepID=A0A2W5Y670_9MICO|nr:enterochelin esterase domain-containing protein [Xylanimonas oleitrophica]PZR53674.1 hypothetical protein DNL40_05945 [Xylanimonas oleitrophica]